MFFKANYSTINPLCFSLFLMTLINPSSLSSIFFPSHTHTYTHTNNIFLILNNSYVLKYITIFYPTKSHSLLSSPLYYFFRLAENFYKNYVFMKLNIDLISKYIYYNISLCTTENTLFALLLPTK